MKCIRCGKEIDKDKEKNEFNKRTREKPSYDMMGFQISDICLQCREKKSIELVNEIKCHNYRL